MYDMCEILIDVLLSAAGALMWCVLISFCCMCIEHLFFKKQIRPRLTDKEIILIKEVLAGNISLPLVVNDGLFVECVDRIERIFERFITRSRQQTEQLEEISKTLEAKCFETIAKNDYVPEPFTIEDEPLDIIYPQSALSSGASFQEMVDQAKYNIGSMLDDAENKALSGDKGYLLEEPIYSMRLPTPLCCILRKKMRCYTVKDVLELLLYVGSRKGLLKIRGIGEASADKLETFMFDTGLIHLQGYTYQSNYADIEVQDESNKKNSYGN